MPPARLARVCGPFKKGNSRQKNGREHQCKNGPQRQQTGARQKEVWQGGGDCDRKHRSRREVGKLLEATAAGRNPYPYCCPILLMFRHGLRVSEAYGMKLHQVDTESCVFTSRA